MKRIVISQWHDSSDCNWCDRTKECVTAEHEDGFLSKGPMCWACLRNSVQARSRCEQTSKERAVEKA